MTVSKDWLTLTRIWRMKQSMNWERINQRCQMLNDDHSKSVQSMIWPQHTIPSLVKHAYIMHMHICTGLTRTIFSQALRTFSSQRGAVERRPKGHPAWDNSYRIPRQQGRSQGIPHLRRTGFAATILYTHYVFFIISICNLYLYVWKMTIWMTVFRIIRMIYHWHLGPKCDPHDIFLHLIFS